MKKIKTYLIDKYYLMIVLLLYPFFAYISYNYNYIYKPLMIGLVGSGLGILLIKKKSKKLPVTPWQNLIKVTIKSVYR